MSDQGVIRGTRRRSISESGHPRLNSTIIDNDLVFDENDLFNTRNNVSHQSQQIISNDLPEGFIESPMWVGTGTRLQARKLPANSDQEIVISNKLENLRLKISDWQSLIEYDPITFDGINTEHNVLKGNIHSLYQEALYARVTDKLSYDIIGLVALIDRVKCAALRYIRNEERIAETTGVNKIIAGNAKENLSELNSSPCDNNYIIIAGGCSGFSKQY